MEGIGVVELGAVDGWTDHPKTLVEGGEPEGPLRGKDRILDTAAESGRFLHNNVTECRLALSYFHIRSGRPGMTNKVADCS